jgi:hypothetical protein
MFGIIGYVIFAASSLLVTQFVLRPKGIAAGRAPRLIAALGATYGFWVEVFCLTSLALVNGYNEGTFSHFWDFFVFLGPAFIFFFVPTGIIVGYLTGLILGLIFEQKPSMSRIATALTGLIIALLVSALANTVLIPLFDLRPLGENSRQFFSLLIGMPGVLLVLISSWGAESLRRRLVH